MNKLLVGAALGIVILALLIVSPSSNIEKNNSAESNRNLNQPITTKQSEPIKSHDHSNHNLMNEKDSKEVGFDFTPYVSEEMADEIRPYTSRSTQGLQVKVDQDGNEYVDLKKRWSHATISVVDENGVKHTGEWAPE